MHGNSADGYLALAAGIVEWVLVFTGHGDLVLSFLAITVGLAAIPMLVAAVLPVILIIGLARS